MKQKKTNAMRMLEGKKLAYEVYSYETHDQDFDHLDIDIADTIHKNSSLIYKTIVLQHLNDHFVAVVPLDKHIDMKKAAKAFKVKKLELFPVKDLFSLTGYVRGGCSPIGMKKKFPTLIDSSAQDLEEIIVSSGALGNHLGLNPDDLITITQGAYADIAA